MHWHAVTNKPNIQVQECYLSMYIKPFRSVNFLSLRLKIPFPDISSPNCQKVDLFCFRILMFTSAQSSVIYSQQLTKSDVLKFGPVSEQGAETTFHKEAAIFFRPNVSLMLIDQFYQQIFASRKLKTFSVVTNQGKFEKKLDFSSNEAGKLIRAICCTKRDPLARAPPGRKNVAGLAAERARSSLPLCLPLPHCLSLAHFLPSSTNLRSLPLSFLLWTWTNAIWFLELQQRLASTSNPFNPPTLIFHHHNICRYVPSLQTSTASLTEQSTHWQFTIPAKPTCLFIVWPVGESPRDCTLRRTLQPQLSQSRRLRRCSLAGHLLPWNTMSRDLLELQAKAGLAQKLLAAAVMVTLVDSLLSIVLC